MSKHTAVTTEATYILETRAVALAERGQFPDGFGQHRAPIDGPTELHNNIRTALYLTGESA